MARKLNLLSPKFIETIDRPGRYSDGGGLYLQVTAGRNGVTKCWLFRYMRGHVSRSGKPMSREMGLGPLSTNKRDGYISTKEARDRAYLARESLKAGVDPLERQEGHQSRTEAPGREGRDLLAMCCGVHQEPPGGLEGREARQALEGLSRQIRGAFNGRVTRCQHRHWARAEGSHPDLANQNQNRRFDLRSRIELILDWAKIHGYRDGENPARWKGHLKNALPDPSKIARVTHLAAMPYDEIPDFMGELRQQTGNAAAALEWTILAAARTDDTLGAAWPEIDFAKKVWTIPAARMKAATDHRVPLTDRMIGIIESQSRDSKFVFSGKNPNKKLPHEAMLKVLKAIRPGITVHGYRSTFRDWAAERTSYPNHVVEMALAHAIGNKVEASYRRGDLFEKRQRLMADWAAYCAKKPSNTANVTPLRQGVTT